jgi:beta-lactamase regulating signal transducer with metallopeptidase domain
MASLLEIVLSNAVMATLLALLAFGLGRLHRRPAFVHGLWLVVLLKLVTPPLVMIPLPWFEPRPPATPEAGVTLSVIMPEPEALASPYEPAGEAQLAQAELPAPAPEVPAAADLPAGGFLPCSWCLPLFLVWLAGSLCVFAWIVRSIVRFRRLLRFARLADPQVQEMVKELAGRLKLARHPDVWLVPGRISPMLWALGRRPRLIFPADLLGRLDREKLRTILLHELAHWRRRDHWVRLLELAVTVLYWWHPAAWWVRAELHEAEEQCCDAWVIGVLEGADRTYALALLETVAFFSRARLPLPVAASGIGQVSHLRRRLTMIMNGQNRRSLTWAGCAGLVAFGMLLLPLVPVRAQPPEKKEARGNIVVDGEGTFEIVLGDDGNPDQEAMELLKRALKLLAEKKQAKTNPGAKPANPEEIKKLQEQVEILTSQANDQRRALEATDARLREARARLTEAQGGSAPGKSGPYRIELRLDSEGGPKKPAEGGGKGKGSAVPGQLEFRLQEGKSLIAPGQMQLRLQDGKAILLQEQKGRPQPDELKSRLERLLKEAEELRREIERTRPSGTP